MKEQYIEYATKTFAGEALNLVLNQIKLFFDNTQIILKNKYNLGDEVSLKKGTFIHGIPGLLDNFNWVLDNGFVSSNFSGTTKKNKYFHNVGVWNIQKDCLLKDYIQSYSGTTIGYTIGRGPESKKESILVPYKEFENTIEKLNNDPEIWMWYGEQTKEIRFIPSLASNKIQIAFILNTESNYAKSLSQADLFNPKMTKDILKYFIVEQILDEFIQEPHNCFTTNRESAIMFGLPSSLIEGILVGRTLEKDIESLNYIKNKLPDCYICNLDGKVIIGNK